MVDSEFNLFLRSLKDRDKSMWEQLSREEFVNKICDSHVDEHFHELQKAISVLKNCRPVHIAAFYDNFPAFQWLVEHGSDPNSADDSGMRPIHYSSLSGSVPITEWLIERGTDPNCCDKNRMRPIHYAAMNGNISVIDCLVIRGADPNCCNCWHMRPILYAAMRGTVECMQCLVDRGANLNCSNTAETRPIHCAARNGHVVTMKWLVDHGVDPNVPDKRGMRSIHYAARNGQVAAMEWLLSRGADLNCADKYHMQPIHYASRRGHVAAIRWLVEHGCSIECKSERMWRPLHYACSYGHNDAVLWLITAGALIDARDEDGRTPLDIAYEHAYDSCGAILQQEQARRENEEFQILHLPKFSIICRKYKIYDSPYTVDRIQEAVYPLQRPVVICHLVDPLRYVSRSMYLTNLVCDDFRYSEFIAMAKWARNEKLESEMKRLRDWRISVQSVEFIENMAEVTFKVNTTRDSTEWRHHSVVHLTLTDEGSRVPLDTLDMMLLENTLAGEIKEIFIEFLTFVYLGQINAGLYQDSFDENNVKGPMERLLMTRKQLLTFYDSNQQKLSNLSVLNRAAVARDVSVVQKCVTNIKFLSPESNSIQPSVAHVLSQVYVLARCLENDSLTLAIARSEFQSVSNVRSRILSFLGISDKLIMIGTSSLIRDDTKIDDIDEVIHLAIISPYRNITKLDKVGKGGFGVVYKCKMADSDQIFAMKKIEIKRKEVAEVRKDIQIEILVAAKVGRHDRIISYHRFLENESAFFIIMDLMKESLSDHLRDNHPLAEEKIVGFAKQILEGLKFLHNHKIIHRDLKGANVLLDENHSVKLSDFGISKCLTENTDKASMEGGSTVTGTWRWMAPEVICPVNNNWDGRAKYGLKSDIWSFGATMVEMITGHPPYHHLLEAVAVFKIGLDKRIEYEYPACLSATLNDFVTFCLTVNPDERPNCATLLQSAVFLHDRHRKETFSHSDDVSTDDDHQRNAHDTTASE